MGYIHNLFATAGEVAQLTREALFYRNLYEHELEKNGLLEKAILAERKRRDEMSLKTLDLISKQNGLPMIFKEKVERVQPEPQPLSILDEERIVYIAEAMRNDDLDIGNEDRPIEAYVNAIKLNPDKYLNGR